MQISGADNYIHWKAYRTARSSIILPHLFQHSDANFQILSQQPSQYNPIQLLLYETIEQEQCQKYRAGHQNRPTNIKSNIVYQTS